MVYGQGRWNIVLFILLGACFSNVIAGRDFYDILTINRDASASK